MYTTGTGVVIQYHNVADSRRTAPRVFLREDQQDLQQETHGYQVAMADKRGWSWKEVGQGEVGHPDKYLFGVSFFPSKSFLKKVVRGWVPSSSPPGDLSPSKSWLPLKLPVEGVVNDMTA